MADAAPRMADTARPGEVRPLTALRGLAAMAVVTQHFSATAQAHANTTIPSLVPHGYMAVDFFFVLSGFIMCYTYLARFERSGMATYGDFLARRAARVLPLNVAVLLLIFAAGMLCQALGTTDYVTGDLLRPPRWGLDLPENMLLLPPFGIGENLNGPSWSISVEAVAYLLFPLLILPAFHPRPAVRLLLAAVALVIMSRINLAGDGSVQAQVLRCLCEFSLGMLSFGVLRAGQARRIGSDGSVLALLASIAALLLARQDFLAAILFPPLVLATARNQGLAARLLSADWVWRLGVISYSLYLLHNMFRMPLLALLTAWHPAPLSAPAALAFAAAGSLAVIPFAVAAHRLVEQPGRGWVRALFHSGRG